MFKKAFAVFVLLVLSGSALAFDIVDSKGHHHSLAGYKGKWVLVNFWATWCPPCRAEIPDLIALSRNNANKLVVLGVAMDYQDTRQVTRFAESAGIPYPIIFGDDSVSNQIGPVSGLPTTYLYNPEGKMVAYNVGALTRESVERYMAKNGKPVK